MPNLYTIGFTKKTAEHFFNALRNAGVKRLVDVRLNNGSQLAGFTKKEDLRFFLQAICGIEYAHAPEFAPTQEILDAFKKGGGDWDAYERAFMQLMSERRAVQTVTAEMLEGACLLCSEDAPDHCHRRLVAECLAAAWPGVTITHLR